MNPKTNLPYEHTSTKKKRGWSFWTLIGCLVFVLYVLSMGPALKYALIPGTVSTETWKYRAFNTLYYPLETTVEFVPPLRWLLEWYLEIWSPMPPQSFGQP